jgi:Ca2+-binding EF-hand superfamily protein
MFDSDTYFKEFNSFVEESELSREMHTEKVILQIWKDFDSDNDGKLVKEEVQAFLQATLGDDWAVEEFDMIFNALD